MIVSAKLIDALGPTAIMISIMIFLSVATLDDLSIDNNASYIHG